MFSNSKDFEKHCLISGKRTPFFRLMVSNMYLLIPDPGYYFSKICSDLFLMEIRRLPVHDTGMLGRFVEGKKRGRVKCMFRFKF